MKETLNTMNRQATEWQEIFANYVYDKELVFRIREEPPTLNSKKMAP